MNPDLFNMDVFKSFTDDTELFLFCFFQTMETVTTSRQGNFINRTLFFLQYPYVSSVRNWSSRLEKDLNQSGCNYKLTSSVALLQSVHSLSRSFGSAPRNGTSGRIQSSEHAQSTSFLFSANRI